MFLLRKSSIYSQKCQLTVQLTFGITIYTHYWSNYISFLLLLLLSPEISFSFIFIQILPFSKH